MCVNCVCKIAECINYVNYVKYSVNKRGGKAFSPQTDSVPSVDRAISCFNKHINTKHLNDDYTSGCDVYGGAAWGHHTRVTHYSSYLLFYTSSFLFPWDCSHLFPSKTYALPSHGGIRLSSLRFTRSDYPPLSRGLLLRASSSQNGPPALWWKANRLPRGSGSLDRYMLIAA